MLWPTLFPGFWENYHLGFWKPYARCYTSSATWTLPSMSQWKWQPVTSLITIFLYLFPFLNHSNFVQLCLQYFLCPSSRARKTFLSIIPPLCPKPIKIGTFVLVKLQKLHLWYFWNYQYHYSDFVWPKKHIYEISFAWIFWTQEAFFSNILQSCGP